MRKILIIAITTLFFTSCNKPLSKGYTEDGFMLDMVEVRKSEGGEIANKITSYIVKQSMRNAINAENENTLIGKTYEELLREAEELEIEMKEKEEEEKRLALEEEKRKKEIYIKISQSLTFAITKKGFTKYNYQDYITYTFTFKNKTDRDISGVKGMVTFYDMFDEKITNLRLSYDDGITAGKTINYKAQTDYNQFKSEDTKLKNTELKKLKAVWEPQQLIFSDGEKIVLE